MKKISIIIIAFIAMTSCGESNQKEMALFKKNANTAKEFYTAFSNKEMPKMRSFVTKDFKWTPPIAALDSLDVNAWENQMKSYHNLYDNIEFTDQQYFAGLNEETQKPTGDVRVYGTWKSNYKLTGDATEMDYYAVLFFNENGKITSIAEWFNLSDIIPNSLSATKDFANDLSTTDLGNNLYYPRGKASLTNRVVVLKPGQSFPVHKHPYPVIVNVIKGEFTVDHPDIGKTIIKKAGEVFVGTPNVWHQAKNNSAEETVLIGTIMGIKGKPTTINKK
tara:strand:+ start:199 stop:1029 length:831 start_codon:yes stop_codon:yes gene_type:complete